MMHHIRENVQMSFLRVSCRICLQLKPEAVHSSSSQLCSWCVLFQLMSLITNFAAVWFPLTVFYCDFNDTSASFSCVTSVRLQLFMLLLFSVCGWWSSLWCWWRLKKMARTSRQKTRIRTLPTRKPTSRNFCLSLCLDGQTDAPHRRNVIKVGNDHQTSMSAFIHLPPGDTWDQPDYTVIFRGFSVCLFV